MFMRNTSTILLVNNTATLYKLGSFQYIIRDVFTGWQLQATLQKYLNQMFLRTDTAEV